MSKKMLFTASTQSHIDNFHLPYLNAFEEMGWEVTPYVLPVSKRFFSVKNLAAINTTRKLINKEKFDIISSQSTLAGIVTRLAVLLCKKSLREKMKVFHTAHGYLFNDDNGLKKWAYLLPEMICSRATDVLMVMNHEDLDIARKYKLCKKTENIHYINGMGIDLSRFQTAEGKPLQCTKEQKEAFGIAEDDFVFVYAAEFSKRKNHELLLRGFADAVKQLEEQGFDRTEDRNKPKNQKLVLAGDGILLEKIKTLATNLGIRDRVIFLGYIKNVHELYPCCDVAVSTSKIEGLPFNIMEAMACGLPVIASDIKGHRELVEHGVNGLLFNINDPSMMVHQLVEVFQDEKFRRKCKENTVEQVKLLSNEHVFPDVMGIYELS